ncbi:MAG: fimbrillin family protein [Bacteroidales bacterium]|nr:fimbrillin family protein [Bacteroidales bacterium]
MKKIFFSLLAIAAIASCAKTEDIYTEGDSEIVIAPVTSHATKAAVYGSIDGIQYPVAENFKVNAYWTNGAESKKYLNDVVFTNKSGNFWHGANATYYWPKNGTLQFACYSPATTPGVTHDPQDDKYTVEYTQSRFTDQTEDFMLAPITMPYTAQTAKENVSVVFEHTMAWITLKVKAANADAAKAFTVHDLIINDVNTTGTLVAEMGNGVQYDEWSAQANPVAYEVVKGDAIVLTTAPEVVEDHANGTVVIPQETTTLTINFTQNQMTDGSGAETTPELTEQTITIPLELDQEGEVWRPGKHYIYTVVFDLDEILINPSVADWEDVVVNDKVDDDPGYIATADNEKELLEALAAEVATIQLTSEIELASQLDVTYSVAFVDGGFKGAPINVTGSVVSFENVAFANGNGTDESAVYVRTGNTNISFENCTFTDYQWEAIQYVSESGDWFNVNGCTFNAEAHRDLHLQVKYASEAEVKITNNKFYGTDTDSYVTVYGFAHERMILESNETEEAANTVNVWISDVFNGNNLTLKGFVNPTPYHAALTQSTILNGDYTGYQMVLNGHDLDGNGYLFTIQKSDVMFAVTTSKGHIRNLDINGYNTRNSNNKVLYGVVVTKNEGDLYLYNVNVANTAYAFNTQTSGSCDYTLTVENSSLEGWTSYSSFKSAKFINTAFVTGDFFENEVAGEVNVWNATVKPYVTTVFEGCTFDKGFNFDLSELGKDDTVTFKGCKVAGVELTADNVATYLKGDLDVISFE